MKSPKNLNSRIDRLRDYLREKNLDVCLINDSLNLFYYTGLSLSTGYLWIDQKEIRLFVDPRYGETCEQQKEIPVFVVRQFTKALRDLVNARKLFILFDSSLVSYSDYQKLKETFSSDVALMAHPCFLQYMRRIKDTHEIELMRKSASLAIKGYEYAKSLLKEGITEKNLAMEIEVYLRQQGADKMAFDSIISFGVNTSKPHYTPQEIPLKMGEMVLIDLGVNKDYYASDCTRMLFFGDPRPELAKIYEIVKSILSEIEAFIKPSVLMKEVDQKVRDLLQEAGYLENFIHTLGHGVGLDIHELPNFRSDQDLKLQPGMVLAIEPGIYLPSIGGVRLEDILVVTQNGCEILTHYPL